MKKHHFFFAASGLFALWLWAGCSTTQTAVAYKGEAATQLAIDAAMTGWGTYVAVKHPGPAAELNVFNAFEAYKNAELALIDATAALASNPTNTAPLTAAQSAVAASQADLVNLISTITNALRSSP